MTDLTTLGIEFDDSGSQKAVATLDKVATTSERAGKATDGLSGSLRQSVGAIADMTARIEKAIVGQNEFIRGLADGAAQALREAAALRDVGAAAAAASAATGKMNATQGGGLPVWRQQNEHVKLYQQMLKTLPDVHSRAASGSKQLQAATLNLSRQFADVGVTAAMGMNPLMILIQQGPQIADALAMVRAEGKGVGAAFALLGAQLAPVLAALAPFIIAATLAAAAFALFAREVKKGLPKDVTEGLGLTEKQLARVKDKTISFGDVFKATFEVIWDHLRKTDAAKGFASFMSKAFDAVAKDAWSSFKALVGAGVYAWELIKGVFTPLPAVLGDLFQQGVNNAIKAVEWLVNKAIEGVNKLAAGANVVLKSLGWQGPTMGQIAPVSLAQQKNTFQGAASRYNLGAIEAKAMKAATDVGNSMDRIGKQFVKEVGARALKDAQDKAKKEAGAAAKPKKEAKEPRDLTDELTAKVAQEEQRALRELLSAELALTTDTKRRIEIQHDIIQAQVAEKNSAVEREIANLEDQKLAGTFTQTVKDELIQRLRAVQATNAIVGLLQDRLMREAELRKAAEAEIAIRKAGLQNDIDLLSARKGLLKSGYAQRVVDVQILSKKQEQERLDLQLAATKGESLGYSKREIAEAQARLKVLPEIQAAERAQADEAVNLSEAMREAANNVSDFKNAFRQNDFGGLLNALAATIQTIQKSAAQSGLIGGGLTAASAVGGLIGGKTGKAIGKAGMLAAGGIWAGGTMASMGVAASFAGALSGSAASVAVGNLMLLASNVIPILGAVAALAVLAKAFQKPSNKGAGFDLVTGDISGKSRDAETEDAVKKAGQTIMQMQETLKGTGIKLGDTIRGLVIGSRDPSQIYTTSGKTITSAVGDPAAAAEAAFKAMLDGATYVSDTQKSLVESMMAAGKGFDDITAALQGYSQAQAGIKAVSDAILQLTDPKAFDLQAVAESVDAQRQAFKDAADLGYIAADQLAAVNAQLDVLKGLQIDEVMKRYANAATDASKALELQIQLMELTGDAAGALAAKRKQELDALDPSLRALQQQVYAAQDVADAQSALVEAYNRESAALQSRIDTFQRLADSLHAYLGQLTTGSGVLPAGGLATARAAFNKTASAAAGGDETALGNLQSSAEAFLQASREAAPDAETYRRDVSAVKKAVQAAEEQARSQVSIAKAQLDAMTAAVGQLAQINSGVLSVVQAINALQAALAAMRTANTAAGAGGAGGGTGTPGYFGGGLPPGFTPDAAGHANDLAYYDALQSGILSGGTTADFVRRADAYLTANPDVAAAYVQGTFGSDQFATREAWALSHYQQAGRGENRQFAAGIGSATAGLAWVGEQGAELVDLPGGSRVVPNHMLSGTAQGNLEDKLDELIDTVRAGDIGIARHTAEIARLNRRWDGEGLPETRAPL